MENRERVCLIDGDTLIWNINWNLQNKSKEEADFEIDNYISLILRNTKADSYLGFLGESKTFRHQVYESYKCDRPEKPEWFTTWEEYTKNRLIETWKFILSGILEAEDCVSICAYEFQKDKQVIVAHIDKDLNQVTGEYIEHYNFNKHTTWYSNSFGSLELIQKSKSKKLVGTGTMWLYAQVVLGDSTDSIPRMKKGCGDVYVYNLLSSCTTELQLMDKVYQEFLKHSSREAFILNRTLVKMLDKPMYNFVIPKEIEYKKVEINIFEL